MNGRFDRLIPAVWSFALWIAFSSRLDSASRVGREAGAAKRYLNVRKPTKALTHLTDNNESKPEPTLPPETMARLGRELRQMYAEIIAEGVPERLAEILRKLDEPSNEGETR